MGSKIEEHHVKKERSWFYYLNLLIGSYLGIKDINDGDCYIHSVQSKLGQETSF